MAEDNVKHIHIEDGDAETAEKVNGTQTEEAAAEDSKAEEPQSEDARAEDSKSEEAGAEEAGAEEASKADDKKAEDKKAEEKKAEEQESERYMRLMAEFQNFKRRAAREKTDTLAYANEKIIGELLPVLDNFERALETDAADAEGYAKGMELIFQQLKTALEHAGLEEIKALGEDFDPNVHNAVMTEQSEEHEDGKVSKVLQKGYKLKDKVIRPSMVAVVRN